MMPTSAQTVRISAVLLFLWFGYQQLVAPGAWVDFLPAWTGYFPIPGEMLVQVNGLMEVILAVLFALGTYTRLVAFLLGAHLLLIAITAGGAIGVRDAALAFMTLSLCLGAPDAWTWDAKQPKKTA